MNLEALPPFAEDGSLNVIVETPRGCRKKYAYDSERGLFQLRKVLPAGMNFPFDFGFVPGTRGEDGDPLDILLLMDEPATPGCLVASVLLGVIEAKQTEDGKTVRNDRLIAHARASSRETAPRDLAELGSDVLRDIEAFFANYNQLEGKKFTALRRAGAKRAKALIVSHTIEPT